MGYALPANFHQGAATLAVRLPFVDRTVSTNLERLTPEPEMDLSLVIPCHNEEAGLLSLRAELGPVLHTLSQGRSVEVVFVDDGSTDATWERLSALRDAGFAGVSVRLERHGRNRGLGAALRTGFAAARGAVVVTTDSDATYRFSEIPALLKRLGPQVDIVTASPYHPEGAVAGVPAYRLVLSRGSSLIYRTLVGRHIYTYTALFRAYRADVLRTVPFQSDGFLAVAELLVNAMLCGYRVVEFPATLHSRVAGASKAKLLRTIVAHLRFQSDVLMRRVGLKSPPNAARRAAPAVAASKGTGIG
jgi:dolichol-phosphate mannosyltransferase